MLLLLRSPVADLAVQIVDRRIPSRFSDTDLARALALSERIAHSITGQFRGADVLMHLQNLELIAAALPMAGANQVFTAIETVAPGTCMAMVTNRAQIQLLQTLSRLAEMFRLDRLLIIASALRQRAEVSTDV